jgi:hypothetical protein
MSGRQQKLPQPSAKKVSESVMSWEKAQKTASESQILQGLPQRRAPESSMLSTIDVMDVTSSSQNTSPEPKKTSARLRSSDHIFTLGIEEELQIIDPNTRELRSYIQQILADGKVILKEQLKPELHQSTVELGTEICNDPRDVRKQVVSLRTELANLAARDGLQIASAGTHPFSHWMDQLITANERYATSTTPSRWRP